MSSSLSVWRIVAAPRTLTSLVAIALACASQEACSASLTTDSAASAAVARDDAGGSRSGSYTDDGNASHDAPSAPSPSSGSSSGGATQTNTALGNPLCGRNASSCSPDDAIKSLECAQQAASSGDAASAGASDGSSSDAGASSRFACRVQRNAKAAGSGDGGEYASGVAACANAGFGEDGDACSASADCAPGFECVGTPASGGMPKGAVCRRYCCGGACSQADRFCGVLDVIDASAGAQLIVPVCLPPKPCNLLQQAPCAEQYETCGIVNVGSKTMHACVVTGPQREGESCDVAQCAAGHVCLGPEGQRTCFRLCSVGDGAVSCDNGERCSPSSAIFGDTSVGYCEARSN